MKNEQIDELSRLITAILKATVPVFIWILIAIIILIGLVIAVPAFIPSTDGKIFSIISAAILVYVGIQLIRDRKTLGAWLNKRVDANQEKARKRYERLSSFAATASDSLTQKLGEAKQKNELVQTLRNTIRERSGNNLVDVIGLGGSRWEHLTGKKLSMSLTLSNLYLSDFSIPQEYSLPFEEICDIAISGPGKTITGGGATGGGFGIDGFLIGATAATLLNLLSTHTSTKTIVRFSLRESEVFLLISTHDPDGARLYLSPIFASLSARLTNATPSKQLTSVAEEISRLAALRKAGDLTDDEFTALKEKLLVR